MTGTKEEPTSWGRSILGTAGRVATLPVRDAVKAIRGAFGGELPKVVFNYNRSLARQLFPKTQDRRKKATHTADADRRRFQEALEAEGLGEEQLDVLRQGHARNARIFYGLATAMLLGGMWYAGADALFEALAAAAWLSGAVCCGLRSAFRAFQIERRACGGWADFVTHPSRWVP